MKSLILTAFALTLSYAPAQAQQQCSSYAEFVKISIDKKATRKLRYASVNRRFVEVWATDQAVIVIAHIDGMACIIDKGYLADLPV